MVAEQEHVIISLFCSIKRLRLPARWCCE